MWKDQRVDAVEGRDGQLCQGSTCGFWGAAVENGDENFAKRALATLHTSINMGTTKVSEKKVSSQLCFQASKINLFITIFWKKLVSPGRCWSEDCSLVRSTQRYKCSIHVTVRITWLRIKNVVVQGGTIVKLNDYTVNKEYLEPSFASDLDWCNCVFSTCSFSDLCFSEILWLVDFYVICPLYYVLDHW